MHLAALFNTFAVAVKNAAIKFCDVARRIVRCVDSAALAPV